LERNGSHVLLVDLSRSVDFGTQLQTKRELIAELGATLAMSAVKNNDKIGMTLFSNEVEKAIPPRKGSRHVLRIIRELLYCESVGSGTNIRKAVEHLNRTCKRRSGKLPNDGTTLSQLSSTIRWSKSCPTLAWYD